MYLFPGTQAASDRTRDPSPQYVGHDKTDQPYSRLAHLIGALRLSHDVERAVVMALTAYFDASGAPHQGTVLVVAGFLSFERRWLELERRWSKLLTEAGIECFHMTDFINCKREFADWKGKDKTRQKFLESLGRIVVDGVVKSFASYVVLEDWRQVEKDYQLSENDFQPYSLAGWSCIERVRSWCDEHGYDKKQALFVFEDGDLHQFNLKRRAKKDYGVIIQTETKSTVTALQSADFAAWQLLNLMRTVQAGAYRRQDVEEALEPWLWDMFNKLFASVPYEHSHFSLQPGRNTGISSLIRLCRDYGVPCRV